MLQLAADRQLQPLRNEANLVLPKRAEELHIAVGRQESQIRAVPNQIMHQSVARAGNNVLAMPPRETILEIDIKGVQFLGKSKRNPPMGPVVVSLDGEIRILRHPVRPS